MERNFEVLVEITPQIIEAAVSTLKLAILAFIFAQALGLGLAQAKSSRQPTLRRAAIVYIDFFRGTPLLVQIFLVYFALPSVGILLSTFWAAAIALAMNGAAYIAEIYRSGFLAVDVGQREAAQSIGMRRAQTLYYIILPQVVRVILPPTVNAAISTMKDTSVAALISNPDLMLRARDLSSEYFRPVLIYGYVAVVYFVLAYPLSKLASRLERRLNRAHV
jgi:His/Glu/Gln/Arg/opine family amino acid ABC transporter permease subunit